MTQPTTTLQYCWVLCPSELFMHKKRELPAHHSSPCHVQWQKQVLCPGGPANTGEDQQGVWPGQPVLIPYLQYHETCCQTPTSKQKKSLHECFSKSKKDAKLWLSWYYGERIEGQISSNSESESEGLYLCSNWWTLPGRPSLVSQIPAQMAARNNGWHLSASESRPTGWLMLTQHGSWSPRSEKLRNFVG